MENRTLLVLFLHHHAPLKDVWLLKSSLVSLEYLILIGDQFKFQNGIFLILFGDSSGAKCFKFTTNSLWLMCVVTEVVSQICLWSVLRALHCSSALDKSIYPFIECNTQFLAFLVSTPLDSPLIMNYLNEVFDSRKRVYSWHTGLRFTFIVPVLLFSLSPLNDTAGLCVASAASCL